MDWKINIITYNLAMKSSNTEAVHNMLNGTIDDQTHLVGIGLQEVAHAETIGGAIATWAQSIAAWVNKNTRMVLLGKTFQATNQVLIFGRKQLIGQIKRIDYRFQRNTFRGLTGHKGSIGVRLQLASPYSIVFVVSHFMHGPEHNSKRIEQYHTNRICSFPEDKSVRAAFWFGDFNFRVEEDMNTVIQKIKNGTHLELLDSREQLKRTMIERDAFIGFREQSITFEPTYRMLVGTSEPDGKRVPSWTDRVLYKGDGITELSYCNNKKAVASDHLPVIAGFRVTAPVAPKPKWEVVFEHLPTWYTSVPLVGRFQVNAQFYKENGSYRDWIGVFPATIDDCTTATNWIYAATCFEQIIDGEKFLACEFSDIPVGSYRLGYFACHLNCIVGLSKVFQIVEQP
ncbi:hypothetical protein GCK72_009764 [Caenorhabditis remanei]|uniref:Inositol polyphosphate-related phosphatase domain-containing protein n=1 Tax=Caenorhabditis remanei TaxID=31234 RepID=A0A6A5H1B8_CAERE|nr:hypothetical protein GCK72_009754 [Caenorhabditis remanei]XP_053587101.1 hypothetical protein GCK72_009764 [Caenorhabditis remanei]KAF1761498.1 hypothetical protein GCK72_009754 [Caenorhabditis remanei]KAF1761508.1 hypothetical protein GCK72_009764 [Caenorhabditis remanei]